MEPKSETKFPTRKCVSLQIRMLTSILKENTQGFSTWGVYPAFSSAPIGDAAQTYYRIY